MKNISKKSDFETETGGGEKVALFYSGYCPFCLEFLPVFEELGRSGPGEFLKVSTDDLPELEDMFSVEVVPTVLFFSGGALAARLDGRLGRGLNKEQLTAFIKTCKSPR